MSPEELSKYAVGLYPMPHVAPSLSLLETMAMGIPCVTHPREGFSEKNHGVSYFLAEKKEEYQKYLSILLHDNDLNKSMSEWSRRFVARNYSMKRWKRAIELSLG
jgi:glycosyltransferase involved in cell wall biosynthesis